jgi:hypothetical protein
MFCWFSFANVQLVLICKCFVDFHLPMFRWFSIANVQLVFICKRFTGFHLQMFYWFSFANVLLVFICKCSIGFHLQMFGWFSFANILLVFICKRFTGFQSEILERQHCATPPMSPMNVSKRGKTDEKRKHATIRHFAMHGWSQPFVEKTNQGSMLSTKVSPKSWAIVKMLWYFGCLCTYW